MTSLAAPAPLRLMAVVVLYKMAPADSPSLHSLLKAAEALQSASEESSSVSILVWDNTPGGQDRGVLPAGVRYRAAPENPGLATAFNSAISLATAEEYDWLLTLDQDTILPPDFLYRMADYIAGPVALGASIAAVVPRVEGDGRVLSPYHLVAGAVPRWFPSGLVGIRTGVYALNSGSILRISSLREVGGYDPLFPLDMSDVALFHKLNSAGRRVLVAGDLLLRHELSLLDKSSRTSIQRYAASLLDEAGFYDLHMGFLGRIERTLRLAGRTWRDRRDLKLRPFYRLTLQELKRRIFVPRKRRIATWLAMAKNRAASIPPSADQG